MTPCILWEGALDTHGYGQRKVDGRNRLVHRLAYEEAHKVELPRDILVHHTCEEPRCINPDHLVAMTRRTHVRLHRNPDNRCRHGHEYTPENTYIKPNGTRRCRECKRIRERGGA